MYTSVENIPHLNASVAFTERTDRVFREQGEITPMRIDDTTEIMPWGADNQMPYRVMDLIDSDETTATCMNFTTETAYGAGLQFHTDEARLPKAAAIFTENNDIDSIYLGQCADMKLFDFCVTVIILDDRNENIIRVIRKHAAYCRLAVADSTGKIPYIAYANWRQNVVTPEKIQLLDPDDTIGDLRNRIKKNPTCHRYAVLSQVPKASSTYYPIPAYASLFRSDWFRIKQLIGKAKLAKLKNAAPLKYHIEVASGYWDRAIQDKGITDPKQKAEFVKNLKEQMIDFLSGAENSGKVLFSTQMMTPDGKIIPEVTVTKISSEEKEGGDYATDIQEAVNMICFAMRVHSNLVGSVPGKAQTNNSGSDKRELYTIAQTLQKPYHTVMLQVWRLVCRFNGWRAVTPRVGTIQLTTLDQHTDARTVRS